MKNISNKTSVLEFYRHVIRDRKSELIDTYIDDAYIQHSPSLKGGKAALYDAVEYLKKMPPSDGIAPFVIAIEDDDFVVLLLDLTFMGRKAVADVFRLRRGKVIEHWDAIQDVSAGDDTSGGLRPIENVEETHSNKLLITDLFNDSVHNRRINRHSIKEDYVEHSRDVLASGQAFDEYLINESIRTVHRIFGEGNFVVVQSEGTGPDNFVHYDFFRLFNGFIVEHWSVKQRIPDKMPHDNGMI